jgi:hypothetical protein
VTLRVGESTLGRRASVLTRRAKGGTAMQIVSPILLVLAFVCFFIAAIKPSALGAVNPIGLGLALWVLNALVVIAPR